MTSAGLSGLRADASREADRLTRLREKTIPVVEIFGPTVQGEGPNTGALTHFVRTGYCGYRCKWCDSMYAVLPEEVKKGAEWMTPGEITHRVKELKGARRVVFSGGDPAMHAGLEMVVRSLSLDGYHCDIETQGELFPQMLWHFDTIVFSPKPPSSGNITPIREFVKNIESMEYDVDHEICVKVVVWNPQEDLDYAVDLFKALAQSQVKYRIGSLWLNAGTPIEPEAEGPGDAWVSGVKATSVLSYYRDLVTRVQNRIPVERELSGIMSKIHVGCQQHVLLWPDTDRGV